MKTLNNNEPAFERLYNEWISTLLAYDEQMGTIDVIVKEMQRSVNDLHYQREVKQICNQVVLQKGILGVLSEELMQMRKKYSGRKGNGEMQLTDLVENNRFRDKIRKAEQSIFMLKYQVNKLLSIAS